MGRLEDIRARAAALDTLVAERTWPGPGFDPSEIQPLLKDALWLVGAVEERDARLEELEASLRDAHEVLTRIACGEAFGTHEELATAALPRILDVFSSPVPRGVS